MNDDNDEIYVPPIRPNLIPPPSRTLYDDMGEENIRQMLRDFYAELARSGIKEMFPNNMEKASQKSADFFIGLFGGPPIYHTKYGSPRMRARHMPFRIDSAARQVWLDCFNAVLDDAVEKYEFPAEHLPQFRQFLDGFSMWMVNRQDS